jgi:hypothetical protein
MAKFHHIFATSLKQKATSNNPKLASTGDQGIPIYRLQELKPVVTNNSRKVRNKSCDQCGNKIGLVVVSSFVMLYF